jgi:hypothetical protein
MSIPKEVKQWIRDLCNGDTSVSVGHMMGHFNENIDNVELEKVLYLIRRNKTVVEYTGTDKLRCEKVAQFVASVISERVIDTFDSAAYPGD